jgi:DNA repair exonuclease SbcCD ATPase subunit
MKERDDAIAEQSLLCQRLEAMEQEQDRARLEVEKAILECAEQCRVLQSELNILRQRYNDLMEENEVLAQNKNNLQQTLVQCQQKLSNLSSRVTTLEVQQESQLKSYFLIRWGLPLVSILSSIKASFPEQKLNAAVKEVLEILHGNKKKCQSYVNKRVKEFLHPLLRMDICMEIHQHFAPWRFLEVLDCSK